MSEKYLVYTKPNCGQCEQAKDLLRRHSKEFQVVNLDVGQEKEEGQSYIDRDKLLSFFPAARTMPQIQASIGSDTLYIGGLQGLRAHLNV